MWGIYETKAGIWWGNDKGPLLYEDEQMAILAARVMDARIPLPAGTTRPRLYDGSGQRKRDDLRPALDAVTAIDRLERGATL